MFTELKDSHFEAIRRFCDAFNDFSSDHIVVRENPEPKIIGHMQNGKCKKIQVVSGNGSRTIKV